jgi:hypothetical protein
VISIAILILWILLSVFTGLLWYRKGRNFWIGFSISAFLSPVVGFIITEFVKENTARLALRKQQRIENFDGVYAKYSKKFRKYGNVSPVLKPHLKGLYILSIEQSVDLVKVKKALHTLFQFLVSPKEKRAENVLMAARFIEDHFLDLDLPQKYKDVINAIMALHGAFDEPKYHTQPEEVLEMIRELPDGSND